jgi:putative effector of murein hydrolase
VTIFAYVINDHISTRLDRNALSNPVLQAVWMIGLVLAATAWH